MRCTLLICLLLLSILSMGNNSTSSVCNIVYNHEDAKQLLYPKAVQIIITIIFPIISIFGIFCNSTFLYVIFKVSSMRTITNLYLANLAVSDLVFLFVGGVRDLYSYFNSPINIGFAFESEIGCVMSVFVTHTCYFCAVFLITLVMYDRFLSVCYPLYHIHLKTRSRSLKLVVSSWIAGLICGFFAVDFSTVETVCVEWSDEEILYANYPSKIAVCKERTEWGLLVLFATDFVVFVLSTAFCCFCIRKIIATLGQRLSGSGDCKQIKDRNQIAKLLVVNTVVFFLCLGPFEIYTFNFFYEYFTDDKLFKQQNVLFVLFWVGHIMARLNSSLNPIITTYLVLVTEMLLDRLCNTVTPLILKRLIQMFCR